MNLLYKYLPEYYKTSETFKEVTQVESDEFTKLYSNIDELSQQFVVDTATWGLAIYEKELQLPIKPNKTFDERRSIIKAKMRGIGKVDFTMIKAIVEAFTNNKVSIEFNGKIKIVFKDTKRIDVSNDYMHYSLDEIKPAHLDYELESRIERAINIITKIDYGSSVFPLCNTVEAGEWPYQQNVGKLNQSKILSMNNISDGLIEYKEVATIEASERLYEDYQFATQDTHESTIQSESSQIERNIEYVKANDVISGEYPYVVVEGKIINIGTTIQTNSKSGISKYPEAALVVSSEGLYEEYKFAEMMRFEFGSMSKYCVSSKELEYIKSNEITTGEHPYTKNEMKQADSQLTSVEESKSNVSIYRLCGEVIAGGDKNDR